MRPFLPITIFAFAALSIAVVFGGEREQRAAHYAFIIPMETHSQEGVGDFRARSIRDADKVRELERFFPEYRREHEKEESDPGGWVVGYTVVIDAGHGRAYSIKVSPDGKIWSMGNGDRSVRGDFDTFVNGLGKDEGA